MKKMLLLFVLFFVQIQTWAQPGSLDLGMLLDMPSARTLPSGSIETELRMYSSGGLLTALTVGISDRFCLGVSYGGENIIGIGRVNLNPLPCVHVRYLVVAEGFLSPALLIGFDSQGYGEYSKDLKRYAIKSRGMYVVASKNTSFLGGIGIHAGMNWSLENEDGDSDPNIFAGCHKRLNSELVLMAEYDTAINDNSDNALGSGKGYLNCGLRWSFFKKLFIEFAWKNVLENRENVPGSSREVKLVYLTTF